MGRVAKRWVGLQGVEDSSRGRVLFLRHHGRVGGLSHRRVFIGIEHETLHRRRDLPNACEPTQRLNRVASDVVVGVVLGDGEELEGDPPLRPLVGRGGGTQPEDLGRLDSRQVMFPPVVEHGHQEPDRFLAEGVLQAEEDLHLLAVGQGPKVVSECQSHASCASAPDSKHVLERLAIEALSADPSVSPHGGALRGFVASMRRENGEWRHPGSTMLLRPGAVTGPELAGHLLNVGEGETHIEWPRHGPLVRHR